MWFKIEEKWPPMDSSENLIDHTIDIVARTSNCGEVITYHDGDVWCYPHLSGCPQYDVIEWRLLTPEDVITYDRLHMRVLR